MPQPTNHPRRAVVSRRRLLLGTVVVAGGGLALTWLSRESDSLRESVDAPEINVHIMPSDSEPRGIGEPGTPVIAPAVANAVYAVSRQRLRSLPLILANQAHSFPSL